MSGKRKRTYGSGTVSQGSREGTWELRYTPAGCRRLSKTVEAPWTTKGRTQAEDALKDWRKELDGQQNPGVKVPCDALFELHLAEMRRMQRNGKNILDQKRKIKKHLVPFFGHREASSIKLTDINEYIDQRLAKGAKPATVNRELSNLRRAFNCGVEQKIISRPLPQYKKLPEDNVREGFIERQVYRRMLANLPCHLHMLWCFGYYLGIRKGELLNFRWEWLLPYWNEAEPIIKIPGKCTKNKKPHTIPLYHPEMRAFVDAAMTKRDPKCPYLFQYRSRQLKSFRTGFEAARTAAGVPDLIFHDTRRTAIREMELAGIPRRRAMQITGHKTESVYKRYDIGDEKEAAEAGRAMRKHWERIAAEEALDHANSEKLGDKLGDNHSLPSREGILHRDGKLLN